MGQIIGGAAKPKRCNLNKLSQLGTPAAGEYILVSSDNSMNAAGQGNFDCYVVGNGSTIASQLEVKRIDNLSQDEYIKIFGIDSDVDERITNGLRITSSSSTFTSHASYATYFIRVLAGGKYTLSIDNTGGSAQIGGEVAFSASYPAVGATISYLRNLSAASGRMNSYEYYAGQDGYLCIAVWASNFNKNTIIFHAVFEGMMEIVEDLQQSLPPLANAVYGKDNDVDETITNGIRFVANGTEFTTSNSHATYYIPVEKGVKYTIAIDNTSGSAVRAGQMAFSSVRPAAGVSIVYLNVLSASAGKSAFYQYIAENNGFLSLAVWASDFNASMVIFHEYLEGLTTEVEELKPIVTDVDNLNTDVYGTNHEIEESITDLCVLPLNGTAFESSSAHAIYYIPVFAGRDYFIEMDNTGGSTQLAIRVGVSQNVPAVGVAVEYKTEFYAPAGTTNTYHYTAASNGYLCAGVYRSDFTTDIVIFREAKDSIAQSFSEQSSEIQSLAGKIMDDGALLSRFLTKKQVLINDVTSYKVIEDSDVTGNSNMWLGGLAIWGDYAFLTTSIHRILVYDMTTLEFVADADVVMPTTWHFNNINFGRKYINDNDQFPVAYITQDNGMSGGGNMCAAVHLSLIENSLYIGILQTIEYTGTKFAENTGADWVVDAKRNCLWCMGTPAADSTKKILLKFPLPQIGASTISYSDSDIQDEFLIDASLILQGSFCYDGIILISAGIADSEVVAVDVDNHSILWRLSVMGIGNAEVEGLTLANGRMYLTFNVEHDKVVIYELTRQI